MIAAVMTTNSPPGPLTGLRVVDLTEHMAGPFCTMILADMGAEVIKVERPGKGDSSRAMGDGSERNPYFRYINRNKKSVTLDYKAARGREVFLALIERADVLVENYRPTVMERAGLGYEVLRAQNPRLIYAQLSGYGYDGPYRDKGGFDLIAQGMGGIMTVNGEPDGPPMSVGLPICDLGTGMWGVQGILAALYERQRTGHGQRVECSLLETAIGFSSWTSAGWLADRQEPTRQGSRHRQNAPYQRFATGDGFIMIGAAGQHIWERCARALGRPEWLEDPRFRTGRDRMRNRPALEREMEAAPRHPVLRALGEGARRRWRAVRARVHLRPALRRPSGRAPRAGRPRRRSGAGPRAAHPDADQDVRGRGRGPRRRAEARPAHRRGAGRAGILRVRPGGAPARPRGLSGGGRR